MMQLRRTGLYRLNRILAAVLPAVIVVLVAIPVWDYWRRSDGSRVQSQQPDDFPQDLAVRGDGFQFTRSRRGQPIFTVTAEVTLGTKDNRRFGQNVDVQIYPQREGDPTRYIRADECSYDEVSGNIDCSRNVAVQFDQTTLGYTDQLTYNNATQVITSEVRTELEQPGEMMGDAGHVIYSMETGLLRLSRKVNIHLTSGATLRAEQATFSQKEHWATVSQGMELLSPNGNIRGGNGRAELEPGTYRPRSITVDGGVTAESARNEGESGGQPWTITSQSMRGDLSAESRIEHVFAEGSAEARRTTESGQEVLSGSEIEAFMDEQGHLKTVEARESPVFVTSGRRLTAANRIVIDPSSKISTYGQSLLDAGNGTTIDGADFTIEQSRLTRLFRTDRKAVLTSRDASGEFRTEGDRTTAEFDPESNQLRRLVQSGSVAFQQRAQQAVRSGYAETMTLTGNGNNIHLEGAARIIDGGTKTTVNAREILLDQNKKSLEGRGNVVVTDNRSPETPVRVTSGRVLAIGDTVEYHERVLLHRGDANITADHITASSATNGLRAQGNVSFRASGGFDASSDELDFTGGSDSGQSATFRGSVVANRRDRNGRLEMKTATMHVRLKPGSETALDSIEARGGVEIRQGNNRTGTGVEADYNAATGQVVLRGSDTVDAIARGPEGETRGFLIQTNPDGRWAAVQPSRISGSVTTSTDKIRK